MKSLLFSPGMNLFKSRWLGTSALTDSTRGPSTGPFFIFIFVKMKGPNQPFNLKKILKVEKRDRS